MKRKWMLLFLCIMLLGFSGVASAELILIGTATYDGGNYNLIYEDNQGLVWLDYTNLRNTWYGQLNWAYGLNAEGVLTYSLNPGISLNWKGNWRLPVTDERQADMYKGYGFAGPDGDGYHDYRYGYNMVNSEMGHLFYVSLGNIGWYDTEGNEQTLYGLRNTSYFSDLMPGHYWSGTEYSGNPIEAWSFHFNSGYQEHEYGNKNITLYALAVRPCEVSAAPVPEPVTIILLGGGLAGLGVFRRARRRRE